MQSDTIYSLSHVVADIKQSGIRSASARCAEMGGINLGQGLCDIPAHPNIKNAAHNAIVQDKNLYAPYNGIADLRTALAKKIDQFNHIKVNPSTEILISHGSTGAYVSAIKTLFNPGDEIILFEPFYSYHRNVIDLLGMKVVTAKIHTEDFSINFSELEKLISPKTKGIVVCTPCNPCGKVFTKDELIKIGEFAKQHGLYIITDEIYEYITYPGHNHISLASLNDNWSRTVTISGFSKTYNVTGWRLGYAYGPAPIIEKMALVHDLLYVCPPTPLQHAMIDALALGEDYYQNLREMFLTKRDLVMNALRKLGCKITSPQGAYYLMADCSSLGFGSDQATATAFLEKAKIAAVPGGAFYVNQEEGQHTLRFCYALNEIKLQQAIVNMQALAN